MEYTEVYIKNGQLIFKNIKQINQSKLTSDCWMVQIKGLDACINCEFKDTDACGGGETLKRLLNEKD